MRVFVTQRWGGGGLLFVPRAQLRALQDDGYREATAAEVAAWRGRPSPPAPTDPRNRAEGRPSGGRSGGRAA